MEELELTDEQWERVKKEWNDNKESPPSISKLTQLIFGDETLDGRTKEGKAIKRKLAEHKMVAITSAHKDQLKGMLELDEANQEFIRNNFENMSAVEMARVLFNKPRLTNLSQEARTIAHFLQKSDLLQGRENPEDVPIKDYRPPHNLDQTITRVQRFVNIVVDKGKLNGKQKKDYESLRRYLHNTRFMRQISSYEKNLDRDLFESSFVRYTYDKFNLTEEEVDEYIVLATEVVIGTSIQARVETLRAMLERQAEDGDGGRIRMGLVEAISTSQTEYHQSVSRQQNLLKSLKVKRSEKESKEKNATANVLNLIEVWKEEETRNEMIDMAEVRNAKIDKTIVELSEMDELKCRVMGISRDEIIHG